MAMPEYRVRWRLGSQYARLTGALPIRAGGSLRHVKLGWCVIILEILGCESKVVIANWSCPPKTESRLLGTAGTGSNVRVADNAGTAGSVQSAEPFELPWSTGFENGFCDYTQEGGFCLPTGSGSMRIVTEPVHSGTYAAAFTVNTIQRGQTRCVRQGTMPVAAYYGAWYFVPALAKNSALWNLFHFRGDNAAHEGHLWDISLVNNDSGALRLTVFNYWVALPDQSKNPAIPIGSWFHVEMYLKLASDETGEVAVYQDGAIIFQLTEVETDNSSGWGQWYVGNLADNLDPTGSTLYVDDVTIRVTH